MGPHHLEKKWLFMCCSFVTRFKQRSHASADICRPTKVNTNNFSTTRHCFNYFVLFRLHSLYVMKMAPYRNQHKKLVFNWLFVTTRVNTVRNRWKVEHLQYSPPTLGVVRQYENGHLNRWKIMSAVCWATNFIGCYFSVGA